MPRKKKAEKDPASGPKRRKTTAARPARKTSPKAPVRRSGSGGRPQKTAPSHPFPSTGPLPSRKQGETRVVAFVRDPQCVFTYWEVTPQSLESVKRQLMEEYRGSAMVLRVFKEGPWGQNEMVEEIQVRPGEMNRYLEMRDGAGIFFVEIGQKSPSGRVIPFARSNRIVTGFPSGAVENAPAAAGPDWSSPKAVSEYFSGLEGEGPDPSPVPGISSAESRRKGFRPPGSDRYSASKIL
jgi:Domain of unknown function (DUF4912)